MAVQLLDINDFNNYSSVQGAYTRAQSDINSLAPFATSYFVQQQPGAVPYFTPQSSGSDQSNMSKFTHFFGAVGSEVGHLAEAAGAYVGRTVKAMVTDPIHLGSGLGHGIVDHINLGAINQQNQELSAKFDTLQQMFKSGQLTASDYSKQLKEYTQETDNLSREAQGINSKIGNDYSRTKQAFVGTATDLVTIAAGGFGKAGTVTDISGSGLNQLETKTVGDMLKGALGNTYLSTVERAISKVAADSTAFTKLSVTAQNAVQRASAEIIATGARMTPGEIARASAANLALKYPLTYGIFEPSAQKFYNQLDNKQYGQAIQTLGYTLGIIAAGGVIPYAMKYGGKALSGLSARTFAQTQYWDELGKFYADNSPTAFRDAVNKVVGALPEAERDQALKDLSAVEATNMAAVGKDTVAAATRTAQAQTAAYGYSTKDMTAEEEVNRMIKFAKWQREADALGKARGTVYTVGRADPRNINRIAATISTASDYMSRRAAWEGWKADNSLLAEANSDSLDRQINHILDTHDDTTAIDNAIRRIKASTEVDGVPKSMAKAMAKDGFIVIGPKNIAAPFVEGTGKLTSSFAQEGDFWTKAVKPVPILSHVAGALTYLGMSPNASTQRVYQVFNDYLGKNLKNALPEFRNMEGESLEQSTDSLIKQASAYMYSENRKGLFNKTPIYDLRQMTVKDWMKATGKTKSEAIAIQKAVAVSHVQVPLAIKGLGEKAVDVTMATRPVAAVAKRYLRLQGALRFAINPFFQYLRVIPKNEILTESKGGGFIRSIFSGRLQQMNEARSVLRTKGFFRQETGFTTSGEATDFAGTSAVGRPRKLLAVQEKSIAGLVDQQALKKGLTVEEYAEAYPNEIKDTIDSIVGYSPKANFLNSPLARTLNIALFPFRFDAKVAMAMGHALGNSGMLTRVAFVNGLYRAHDFLTSPEGQAWYQQNAEVIGLMEYITPLHTMNEVFNSLLPGHDHHIGNFGELGGLPFGWIPQILDAEGITHFNQPGVDAKTGETYKEYIPVTARGQLATAIQDFISSLFSYPGAQLGLPSKTKASLTIADSLTGAKSKTDFNAVTPPLSPEQQSYQQAIGNQAAPAGPGNAPPTAVPVQAPATGNLTPTPQPSNKKRAVKRANFTPTLLPGQSSFGQLP